MASKTYKEQVRKTVIWNSFMGLYRFYFWFRFLKLTLFILNYFAEQLLYK